MSSSSALVRGSMGDIARREGMGLAETWLSAEMGILCDVSGSMDAHDSRGHKTRYEVMIEELEKLQHQFPGKIAVFGFSNKTDWHPNGVPFFQGGSTDMMNALETIKPIDGTGIRITLISDGEPDNAAGTLAVAREFETHIDTIYVGPEGENSGRDFLTKLAKATGGKHQDDFKVEQLASKLGGLLGSGK